MCRLHKIDAWLSSDILAISSIPSERASLISFTKEPSTSETHILRSYCVKYRSYSVIQ